MKEYVYHTVELPAGSGLSKELIEEKGKEGWEQYFPTPEEGMVFIPIGGKIISGPTARYIFRREKRPE